MEDIRHRILEHFEKAKKSLRDSARPQQKRWYAYAGLLLVSVVLALTLGGSRKYPDDPVAVGESGIGAIQGFNETLPETEMTAPPTLPGSGIPEEVPITYDTWGRDPFDPGTGSSSALPVADPDYTLSAISWKGGSAIALIDDFILREGESIHGAELLNILPGCVVLEQGGRKFVLCLKGDV